MFPGHVMRKECSENLTFTGQTERREAAISYITNLCKSMAKEGLGFIVSREILIRIINAVESHSSPHPEGI